MVASLDINLSILKRTDKQDPLPYSVRVTIGKRDFSTVEGVREVFWCCTSGRNFFDCVATVKEYALCWAKTLGIEDIPGLTDSALFSVTVTSEKTCIDIEPVTFNDWILEFHHD